MSRTVFEPYRNTRVTIIGASGFIGRWVGRYLSDHGAQCSLVVRDKSRAEDIFRKFGVRGDVYEADLSNLDDGIVKLFERTRPSITFNLAGYGIDRSEQDEATLYRINSELVTTLCQAVERVKDVSWAGQNIVHVGSALECGDIGGDLSEDSRAEPTVAYGKSKLKGTQNLSRSCQALGLKGITARLFTVYGPGEHANRLLPSLLQTAETGSSLELTLGLQKRDFTYVGDVAEGMIRLGPVQSSGAHVVNLATGELTTVRTFAEIAARLLSIPLDRLHFGAIPTRLDEIEHAPVTIAKLERLAGWRPGRGIEQGITDTLEFIRRNKLTYAST